MQQLRLQDDASGSRSWATTGVAAIAQADRLAIITDLDGTLLPIQPSPALAAPAPATLELLSSLADLPGVTVTVASGRPRETLDAWFADRPELGLVAEHGAWWRERGAWRCGVEVAPLALWGLAEALEAAASTVQGALVERKSGSLALHHRLTPPAAKEALRAEAVRLVASFLAARPEFERLDGKELLEVRPRSAHKGRAVEWVRRRDGPGVRILALGDDVTDEDLFRRLGEGDLGVLVSGEEVARPTAAHARVPGVDAAHALLALVREARGAQRPASAASARS